MRLEDIAARFPGVAPRAEFWSLRIVQEHNEQLAVRRNVVQPVHFSDDVGAMVTVFAGGGMGYAGTCDVTAGGLRRAAAQALEWARHTAGRCVVDFRTLPPRGPGPEPDVQGPQSDVAGQNLFAARRVSTSADQTPLRGEYASPVRRPWASEPLSNKIDLLRRECERLKTDDRIVDWEAVLWHTDMDVLFVTSDGRQVRQRFQCLVPMLSATANEGAETQTRTFGGHTRCRQGGLEVLEEVGFTSAAPRIGADAVELLCAPDCPSGTMDVLLGADQMILQLHESIGHPLELDRILGDERNYAGPSFVTLEMFGRYRYGSELLNVSFDPTMRQQFGSYAFDDEGQPAEHAYIIRGGILLRPLGGMVSQARAGLPGVASARAASWNRPPIDRMANLNIEPGASTFDEMVAAVERGVYMETNCSWSIDDSRNKFQFGCEWGRTIENGRLGRVVKKPNYRGVSATFWRNLKMLGDAATVQVLGTPYCGKGEPNQVIRVGHAAPAALFSDVEVFGGA